MTPIQTAARAIAATYGFDEVTEIPGGVANHVFRLGPTLILRIPRSPAFIQDLQKEVTVIPAARAAGVSTPAVVAQGTIPLNGIPTPYVLMERIPGHYLAAHPGAAPWPALGHQIAQLHQIHHPTSRPDSNLTRIPAHELLDHTNPARVSAKKPLHHSNGTRAPADGLINLPNHSETGRNPAADPLHPLDHSDPTRNPADGPIDLPNHPVSGRNPAHDPLHHSDTDRPYPAGPLDLSGTTRPAASERIGEPDADHRPTDRPLDHSDADRLSADGRLDHSGTAHPSTSEQVGVPGADRRPTDRPLDLPGTARPAANEQVGVPDADHRPTPWPLDHSATARPASERFGVPAANCRPTDGPFDHSGTVRVSTSEGVGLPDADRRPAGSPLDLSAVAGASARERFGLFDIARGSVDGLLGLPEDSGRGRGAADELVERGYLDPETGGWLRGWMEGLRERFDEGSPKVLLHGDLAPQNLMVDDAGRLTALIDWGDAVWGPRGMEFAKLRLGDVVQVLPAYKEHADVAFEVGELEAAVLWFHLEWGLSGLTKAPRLGERHWTAPPASRLLGVLRFLASGPPDPWPKLARQPR